MTIATAHLMYVHIATLNLLQVVATRGIQRVDPAAAVVISSIPDLLSQLQRYFPLTRPHVFPMPQIELTAEVKQQSLKIKQFIILQFVTS